MTRRQGRPRPARGRRPGPRRLGRRRLGRRRLGRWRLGPGLLRPRWRRRAAARPRLRARLGALPGPRRPGLRRAALAAALLAVLIIPIPVLASDVPQHQPACQGAGCHAQAVSAQRWAVPLSGTGAWFAGGTGNGETGAGGSGEGGTVPVTGQAYVAVGGGLAVVGGGLEVTGYRLADGKQQWQLTLDVPAGSAIISVRAWSGAVTVGLLAPNGRSRTEAVIDAATHQLLRRYPAAVFGGTVAASAATTVVVGTANVTSYDNATGQVRWRRPAVGGQSWQVDGQMLYLAESAGGELSGSPVTALRSSTCAPVPSRRSAPRSAARSPARWRPPPTARCCSPRPAA